MAERRPATEPLQTSTRDQEELRTRLERWLAGVLPAGAMPVVSDLETPHASGWSSETLLFEATWREGGGTRSRRCVVRMAPERSAVPVFPSYDLRRQFQVMRLVGERTRVPVPATPWFEPDPHHLGSPFFVMERIDGRTPPDIAPYTFGGWLCDATPEERAQLQRATIEVIAQVHDLDATPEEVAFLELDDPGETALDRHLANQAAYYAWTAGEARIPLLERMYDWLLERRPSAPCAPVVNWGDARPGNVIYHDFTPVGVLDWEMAVLGPREMDLGWTIFLHTFFDDVARQMGLPGIPDLYVRADVAEQYEHLTGHTPHDLEFYEAYAAWRHGIVMARIRQRQIHFGEAEQPADPDDLVMHRAALERMLEGSFWT